MYEEVSAKKNRSDLETKTYADISHVPNNVADLIGGISTLGASDELAVIAVIHFQYENMDNILPFSNFSKIATHRFQLF